jgi:hypothetical protein
LLRTDNKKAEGVSLRLLTSPVKAKKSIKDKKPQVSRLPAVRSKKFREGTEAVQAEADRCGGETASAADNKHNPSVTSSPH